MNNACTLALCGSAFKNKGVQLLLDAVVRYLPAPEDVPSIVGTYNGQTVIRKHEVSEPFSALVFKIATDPHMGRLAFIRVYSGKLYAGDTVLNASSGKNARIGRLLEMHANTRLNIEFVQFGDIAACIGLKDVRTGHTLCDPKNPVLLENMIFPVPVISVAIEANSKADQVNLSNAISKLGEEDPSFQVYVDTESNQTIISGMGELHLEILTDRMRREFDVKATTGKPKVAYRETITKSCKVEGKFIRQSGGRGQYGHVWLELTPLPLGGGVKFIDNVVGGAIPREFISSVEKGVMQQLQAGVFSGFPLVDVQVSLYDGSYHDVDSSEAAFKAAAALGIRNGINLADPVVLEPIMNVQASIPEDYLGSVMGDLVRRRGIIINVHDAPGGTKEVQAHIPLGEMFGYATDIRSMSQGRGYFAMEFTKYAPIPGHLLSKITSAS